MLKKKGVETMYYGDALFAPSGKGEEPVPVKDLADTCMRHSRGEFNQKVQEVRVKVAQFREGRECNAVQDQGRTCCRDHNAAELIRRTGEHLDAFGYTLPILPKQTNAACQ